MSPSSICLFTLKWVKSDYDVSVTSSVMFIHAFDYHSRIYPHLQMEVVLWNSVAQLSKI